MLDIKFHILVKISGFLIMSSYNGFGIGEGGDFGAQNYLPALNLIRRTKPQLSTETPLLLNPC